MGWGRAWSAGWGGRAAVISLILAFIVACQPTKIDLGPGDDDTGSEAETGEGAHGDDSGDPDETGGAGETGETGEPACAAMEAASVPLPAQTTGVLNPIVIRTDAADGLIFSVASADAERALAGTLQVEVADGQARFDGIEVSGAGLLSLVIQQEGCQAGLTVGPLVVGETIRYEPVFLPSGRVGTAYAELLGWDAVQVEALPDGLSFADGWLVGEGTSEGASRFEAAALEGEEVVRYGVQLALFPSDDAMTDPSDEASDPGDYDVGVVELSVSSITTSRGTSRDVAVRVTFPAEADGSAAEGPFPLIVFHHAAHSPSQIYDDYTELHGHWASRGYVVASVDSAVNVSASQSWQNLTDMSTFQLAAMELVLDESADPDSELADRVDPDRVFVAGHSRGGGASLISLWREPSLSGAICFEQVSPLQTPSQDWGDPDANGDRAFPSRPILFLAAGDDLDEPWPLPHSAYDQNSGPTVFVVLHGTNHEWTYDEGTAGSVTSASDISWEERHALDQAWSTAFLERFARGDLSWESSLFGTRALSSALSDRGVSVSGRRYMDTELDIDDFSGDEAENLLGGTNTTSGMDADENAAPYTEGLESAGRGRSQIEAIDAWTPARHLGWDGDGTTRFALTPDGEGLDLSAQRTLTMRVSSPCDPPPGDCAAVAPELSVALVDADGAEAVLDAAEGMGALGVVGRHWSQVILPLDDFLPVDLRRVVAVELRFLAAAPPDDEIWLDDPRFD